MVRVPSVIIIVASLLAVNFPLRGQIVVSLQVTEETGGIIESNFRQALNSLGDISVVGPGEDSNYILRVVVICHDDDCDYPVSYYLSISLSEPMTKDFVSNALTYAGVNVSLPDSAKAKLNELSVYYEEFHGSWVATWGRDRYERAIREFVATLDSRCFEKDRILERAVDTSSDLASDQRRQLMDRWRSEEWLC